MEKLRGRQAALWAGLPLPSLVLLEHAGILEALLFRDSVALMKVRQRRRKRRRREEVQKEHAAYH